LTRGDEMVIQSTFYPFEMFSKRRTGIALQLSLDGPEYEGATNGRVSYIDASAILDQGKLQVFLTNRSLDQDAEIHIVLGDQPIAICESAEILTGPDAKAANSFEHCKTVASDAFEPVDVKNGQVRCQLPPLSFAAMTLKLE
jgi:alpha-N-arabinofuranosidase